MVVLITVASCQLLFKMMSIALKDSLFPMSSAHIRKANSPNLDQPQFNYQNWTLVLNQNSIDNINFSRLKTYVLTGKISIAKLIDFSYLYSDHFGSGRDQKIAQRSLSPIEKLGILLYLRCPGLPVGLGLT